VDLAFRGAGTNGAPRDQVSVILPQSGVQKLGGNRQANFRDVQQQLAGQAQAPVDLKTAVQIRVVDQPFLEP
jgi:hypothetical protein